MIKVHSFLIGSNKRVSGMPRPGFGPGVDGHHRSLRLKLGLLVLVAAWFTGPGVAAEAAGELVFLEAQKAGEGAVTNLYQPQKLVVSPDGENVYATALTGVAETNGTLVTFSRDAETGALTFVDALVHDDMTNPILLRGGAEGLAISPDGAFVYTASFSNGAIGIFSRSESTGELSYVSGVGFSSAVSLAISPDGSHLYVTGVTRDNLGVFSRNAVTGALTFIEVLDDDDPGIDGLNGARSVAVSADGLDVYVGSRDDKGVAAFRRNTSTGELTFVEYENVGAMLSAADVGVAVSPDGGNVYFAADVDDAVFVFDRNTSTGEITLAETQQNGVGGVDGLNDVGALAISSDSRHLYAAGFADDSAVQFNRNTSTGALTYIGLSEDGVDGVDGLNGAISIAVSPDDANAYVAGYADHAVAVFTIAQGVSPAAIVIPAITPILLED